MDTLTKEIIAKVISNIVLQVLDESNFDFSGLVKDKSTVIASEVHKVLHKYGFNANHEFDEETDFKAIEDIISIFENHGYTGGTIHDF